MSAGEESYMIHTLVALNGFDRIYLFVICLIDMYSGRLNVVHVCALDGFHGMLMRDVVTWSLLLNSHSINRKGGISILCLKDTKQRHSHLYRCGRWKMRTCLRCLIEAKKSLRELFDIMNEEYHINMQRNWLLLVGFQILCKDPLLRA